MKNSNGLESKVAHILLRELSADMIERLCLSAVWHQVFLKNGQELKSCIIVEDALSVLALYTPKGLMVLECLSCNALFIVSGHYDHQPQHVVHKEDTDMIRELAFRCSVCDLETDSSWACMKCGKPNPYHLTVGFLPHEIWK